MDLLTSDNQKVSVSNPHDFVFLHDLLSDTTTAEGEGPVPVPFPSYDIEHALACINNKDTIPWESDLIVLDFLAYRDLDTLLKTYLLLVVGQ